MKGLCDFCGTKQETEGTSTVGSYCIECHEIVIGQSHDAIREIKRRKKASDKSLKPTSRKVD